jgi:FecR protein
VTRARRVLLVGILAALPIGYGCRGRTEKPVPAAGSPATAPATREVTVGRSGRLLKVIHAAAVSTAGPARGVRLVRDGKNAAAGLGIELRDGDRLVTDGGTRAVIGTETSAEISLGAGSDLTIRKTSALLAVGSLLVSLKRLFRVETKFVVAGVEGTQFSLAVDPNDVAAVAVLEGSVKVESKVDRWAARSYREGEGCIARGGAEPEKRPLEDQTREQLLRWRQDLEKPIPGTSGPLWEIRPSDRALSTGRIVLDLPEGAEASVDILKGDTRVAGWRGEGSRSLLPGNYDVTISGAPVASVPVQSGMDTRIHAGVLKIKVDESWDLYDESENRRLHGGYGNQSVGLPAGHYKMKIAGGFAPVTIRDNETTEF